MSHTVNFVFTIIHLIQILKYDNCKIECLLSVIVHTSHSPLRNASLFKCRISLDIPGLTFDLSPARFIPSPVQRVWSVSPGSVCRPSKCMVFVQPQSDALDSQSDRFRGRLPSVARRYRYNQTRLFFWHSYIFFLFTFLV